MSKLNVKLIVAALAVALMPTISFANPEKMERPEGIPSWKQAFMEAPVAEVDLAKSVHTVFYSEDSDSDEEDVKANLTKQKVAKEGVGPEKVAGFSGKIQSFFSSVASWFKTTLSLVFVG